MVTLYMEQRAVCSFWHPIKVTIFRLLFMSSRRLKLRVKSFNVWPEMKIVDNSSFLSSIVELPYSRSYRSTFLFVISVVNYVWTVDNYDFML